MKFEKAVQKEIVTKTEVGFKCDTCGAKCKNWGYKIFYSTYDCGIDGNNGSGEAVKNEVDCCCLGCLLATVRGILSGRFDGDELKIKLNYYRY